MEFDQAMDGDMCIGIDCIVNIVVDDCRFVGRHGCGRSYSCYKNMMDSCLIADGWPIWLLIGLVGGLLASWIGGGRRLIGYNLVIGVVSSVVGGYVSAMTQGEDTPQLTILTAMSAAFLAALSLWLFNSMLGHRGD